MIWVNSKCQVAQSSVRILAGLVFKLDPFLTLSYPSPHVPLKHYPARAMLGQNIPFKFGFDLRALTGLVICDVQRIESLVRGGWDLGNLTLAPGVLSDVGRSVSTI
jgi:hypothetical protein